MSIFGTSSPVATSNLKPHHAEAVAALFAAAKRVVECELDEPKAGCRKPADYHAAMLQLEARRESAMASLRSALAAFRTA